MSFQAQREVAGKDAEEPAVRGTCNDILDPLDVGFAPPPPPPPSQHHLTTSKPRICSWLWLSKRELQEHGLKRSCSKFMELWWQRWQFCCRVDKKVATNSSPDYNRRWSVDLPQWTPRKSRGMTENHLLAFTGESRTGIAQATKPSCRPFSQPTSLLSRSPAYREQHETITGGPHAGNGIWKDNWMLAVTVLVIIKLFFHLNAKWIPVIFYCETEYILFVSLPKLQERILPPTPSKKKKKLQKKLFILKWVEVLQRAVLAHALKKKKTAHLFETSLGPELSNTADR